MRILGETKNGFIAEVNKSEIEKFLNLYYNKMENIKVGDDIDLGKGYDHAEHISQAFKETQSFIKSHEKIISAIISGLNINQILGGSNE